ncbi:MAG TPA: nitrogen fixation protein FixH [Roseovarius sp.]|nr:nitrogen fixation protein FixH [Roseovarius sp.]|tara:strand:- start:22 stop:486 length:465 start_codon:yes stop_codon:yes gene_type:complete
MMAERQITGRHVLIGFVAAFSVIIGVNLVLAYSAVRTFPGLEVRNGYIASQTFNERKTAQEALGWILAAEAQDGLLSLRFTDESGRPVRPASVEATVGRATEDHEDISARLTYTGQAFEAPVMLGAGKWILRLRAYSADGTLFQQRREILMDRG